MRDFNGPFLSAASIRRILAIHPFSEANREYLEEEAVRRERWEQEIESLLGEPLVAPDEVSPSPASPSCPVVSAESTARPGVDVGYFH